ncbi:MAG: carbohydrate binding domain-containing protein, partial [Bacteroidota bacterium]
SITRDAADNFVANVAAGLWSLESTTAGVLPTDLVPSGDMKSAVFTGHAAGTCQIKATSGGLPTTNSGTLTVTVAPPPGAIVSDDFSAPTLNALLWTTVNPLADATVSVVGTGTHDALLSIAVPGGVSHDVWVGGNMAPRVMQTISNADFELEVKFQSPLTAQYEMEGVIVQQDLTNFIRFDFVKDATKTRLFAATFVGGAPTVKTDIPITAGNPLYLRVKRVGNQWTESYSYNGTSWTSAPDFTHTLTVSSVGPFIGTAGTSPAPAFTGLVDYFFNMASPIVPEDPVGPVGPATKVRVETAADGSGTVVPAQSIPSGSSITVYSITRDAADNFVANVAASAWSLESTTGGVLPTDLVPSVDMKSAVFTGHAVGTCEVRATSGALAPTNSGTLTVTPPAVNVVSNPSFESGTAPWAFFTNGGGSFTAVPPGFVGSLAAKLNITAAGSNVQLFQSGISLDPGASYRLSFAAYSSTGHDMSVFLQKHGAPYTSYGLSSYTVDLTTSWLTFTTTFTTTGFVGPVSDARLRFWLAPFAAAGDMYFIDNVVLEKIAGPAPSLSDLTMQSEPQVVTEFSLKRNYPNPFNPMTVIEYQLPVAVQVEMVVYNVLGERVATLVNEFQEAGYKSVVFSATGGSASGGDASRLSSGIYFYRLVAGPFVETKKMIILK